ncbi:MAG: dTDP-4-dehydrorhamnose 3,5-epimerase family protein [Phycisphaerae bacterium]|nr:dTDP-4-dehydrorhamnose 3,5-epimerase family protein [Phycisphaerae bacterium]
MASIGSRVRLIEGGLDIDARGTVTHVNDFDFKGVDRFYTIRSHRPFEPRGWVGHRRDRKWFSVVQGTVLVAVVEPDDWSSPARDLPVQRFVLSSAKPQVLHVPAGYATGSVALSEDAILVIFSSGKIEDAKTDNYRFSADTWPIGAL